MVETRKDTLDLAGFQSEKRTLEAVPMRIDYQSLRYEHFLRRKGNDWRLGFSLRKGQPDQGEIRETTNLDPYAIRDAFEAVNSPEAAVKFLSEAGVFWPWETVLYSQFREWQEFFRWLRLERESAIKTPMGEKAWKTAAGFKNQFFTGTDSEFTRARFQGAEMPKEALHENEIKDSEALRALRRFALLPEGWDRDRVRVSLGWYDPKDNHEPENWKDRRKTAPKGGAMRREPFLRIEARNILEAIAATIYVDKAHRLRHGKCKHCGKIFKIESGHGQEFCPAPPHLKSSPCKNAYLQRERRDQQKQAKALLLESNDPSKERLRVKRALR